MQKKERKTLGLLGLCAIALATVVVHGQQQPTPVPPAPSRMVVKGMIDTAVTIPYREQKLWFNFPGIVRTVHVEEGQAVKKDDLLVSQDEDIEQAELERLKGEAESEYRIDYYQSGCKVRENEYK